MIDYYSVLDLERYASDDAIKKKWRSLARENHPDLNQSPEAHDKFLEIKEAYEALSDPRRKKNLDLALRLQEEIEVKHQQIMSEDEIDPFWQQEQESELRKKQEFLQTNQLVDEMLKEVSRSKFELAEELANQILQIDPRRPEPYAVKGDIARSKNNFEEAEKNYAFALQFDPSNEDYIRITESMMRVVGSNRSRVLKDTADLNMVPVLVSLFVIVLLAVFSVLSPEKPFFLSWTLSKVVCLFMAGCAVGVGLNGGKALHPFSADFSGVHTRVSPIIAFGFLSVLSYWLGLLSYYVWGKVQKSYTQSLNWLFGTCFFVLVIFSLFQLKENLWASVHMLIFGGSGLFLGSLVGWAVSDGLWERLEKR